MFSATHTYLILKNVPPFNIAFWIKKTSSYYEKGLIIMLKKQPKWNTKK